MSVQQLLQRLLRDDSGVAVLEFAVFATLLLLLVFGSIDLGRAMFTANNLTSASREGARYGARLSDPGSSLTAIRDTAMSKMSPFGGNPIATSQVAVTCIPNCNVATLQSIKVQINYPFSWLTPLPALLNKTMKDTLRSSATFRWEGS